MNDLLKYKEMTKPASRQQATDLSVLLYNNDFQGAK